LLQLFSNVIANALQHGAPGSPIRISIAHAERGGGSGREVVVRVQNRGVIPPELLPKVFDPFRGKPSSPARAQGLGLGLFISTISETQQQAMMTATFFFLTPMIYLSGFIFPIENMPRVIQPLTYLIPLRYFLVIVRGIFLKGVGLDVLWPQAAAMTAWGFGMLALAVARSRKRMA